MPAGPPCQEIKCVYMQFDFFLLKRKKKVSYAGWPASRPATYLIQKGQEPHWETNLLRHLRNQCPKPYKPWGNSTILEPFSQNVPQKYQKPLGFPVFHVAFSRPGKIIKKHWQNRVLRQRKSVRRIPYNP